MQAAYCWRKKRKDFLAVKPASWHMDVARAARAAFSARAGTCATPSVALRARGGLPVEIDGRAKNLCHMHVTTAGKGLIETNTTRPAGGITIQHGVVATTRPLTHGTPPHTHCTQSTSCSPQHTRPTAFERTLPAAE